MKNDIINRIKNSDTIDLAYSFDIAKACLSMLKSKDTAQYAREIIIYVLDNWDKIHEKSKKLWIDIIESCGFYPYLGKYRDQLPINDTAELIRMGYFKSKNLIDLYLHEEQKELFEKLYSGKNLIISAPTSFGKSLLIEEIVASNKYENIVIIQPTLALLDETRKKLMQYNDKYKIIVKTTQAASIEKGNIFLLTAERVLEYNKLPPIDFLVLDEFYKLSSKRDDERCNVLNNAFHLLLTKHNCNFMLLGPNIEGISKGFEDKYNAEFIKTPYSLVVNEEIDYFTQYQGEFGERGEKKCFKESKLFELLFQLKDEQTIVFCSSPAKVRSLSKKFAKYLGRESILKIDPLPLVEWIEKNIHEKWCLVDCLENRIGIHDGALPRHITSSIINYFNEEKLRYLFCTTTIIEGVNTSAKNIIYFDKTKGNQTPIDYFDYSNIKGRAGRMMIHFLGRIYNFNPPPPKEEVIVDIPFFEQNPVSDEVLINLNFDEIKYPESEQNLYLQKLPEDVRNIIKHNGVNVRGQAKILKELLEISDYSLVNWTGFPTYDQLGYVLNLAWDNLIVEGETIRPMTSKKLVKQTSDYAKNQSIQSLIKSNYDYYCKLQQYANFSKLDILDEAIKDAFQTLRHWFQYKVPKWLSVINSLQEYACSKKQVPPGNYLYYANLIENDFLPPHLTLLLEYNIPLSAIKKVMEYLPKDIDEDKVYNYIVEKRLAEKSGLIEYERSFLNLFT